MLKIIRETAGLLTAWYLKEKREMPWRSDPSPYHVYVSEIMLQQTRVDTVRPYYERFIRELPDVQALADCGEDRLFKLWEGLGYYSRVRNMQKAARVIMAEYGGIIPSSCEELMKLPGIGSYTAGAVASIAYHEKEPVVDGNVLRVITRLSGSRENIDLDKTKKTMREELKRFLADFEGDPAVYNQSLMELGALVCIPNGAPLCASCPLKEHCRAHLQDLTGEIPVRLPKRSRKIMEKTVFLVFRGDSLLFTKNREKKLLSGLYALPEAEGFLSEAEASVFLEGMGVRALQLKRLPDAVHVFTHVEWRMRAYEVLTESVLPEEESEDAPLRRFVTPRELEETAAVPEAYRKWPFRIGG